ncbi:MAG: TonB-dependent receptor [Nitrospinae bacterium]|nr:TonB-dependent receptor [Nitrospinota bacterium]
MYRKDFTLSHDEITLIADRLKLILGSRFEHHYYTGFEIQPNGHILWTPLKRHTIWAAVSRAVRTPSQVDRDLKSLYAAVLPPGLLFSGSPTALYSISGNSNYASEELIAYDIGYRFQPSDDISIDIASFYNTYNNLRTYELGNPFLEISSSSAHLIIPTTLSNKKYGETYGLELSTQWQVLPQWRLHASYSNLQVQMHGKDGTTDTVTINREEGTSPRNQFTLRSSYDLHENMEIDAFIRYVDRLSTDAINSYTEMDIRFGWNPLKNLSVSIVGQNMLNGSHTEFKAEGFYIQKTDIQRGIYGKVTWRF